jgi:hypothetical protein
VENLATLRSIACNGRSRHFPVWLGSDDSPHFAEYQQIQLARRREETRSSIGTKLAYACRSSCSKVLKFGSTAGAAKSHKTCSICNLIFSFHPSLAAGGLKHGHAQL